MTMALNIIIVLLLQFYSITFCDAETIHQGFASPLEVKVNRLSSAVEMILLESKSKDQRITELENKLQEETISNTLQIKEIIIQFNEETKTKNVRITNLEREIITQRTLLEEFKLKETRLVELEKRVSYLENKYEYGNINYKSTVRQTMHSNYTKHENTSTLQQQQHADSDGLLKNNLQHIMSKPVINRHLIHKSKNFTGFIRYFTEQIMFK